MKITLPVFIFISYLATGSAFSQNKSKADSLIQLKTDSLENELKKFDSRKIELGDNAADLSDTFKIKIFEKLWSYYIRSDYDKAAEYAQKEIDVSNEIGYVKGIAEGNIRLGVIMDNKGDYPTALDYYHKALKIQNEISDKSGMSQSLGNIGIIYSKQGNYPEALKNWISSLKISEELKDEESMAYCYNGIGIVYKLQNDYENALTNYFRELEIFSKLNHRHGEAAANINIGGIYLKQQKFEEAMKYLTRGLKIDEELGEKRAVASAYHDIGTVYFQKKKHDEALNNFLKALKIREEMDDLYGLSTTYIHLGNVYFREGDNQKAILNIEKGLEIATKIGELEWMKDAYKSLAEIYDSTGNYKLAYQNSVLFKQINDSMFSSEKHKKLVELQMNYEQSKKDALAAEEIKNQKLIRNYIFIGMTVIVILLVISLIQRNRIAGVKRQQSLEQERSRISRDLHDDLGSGLTGILMMSEQIQATDNRELIGNSLEKIKHSSRNMVDQMGEIIWAMNVKNDTLENLLTYIHTYALDYFENQNIKLNLKMPEKIPDVVMTGMMRRNIFLVMKESLNNILKHAGATEVNIKIESNNSNINITLTDNGKGFEKEKTRKFGNGLKNMESRMSDISGTITIESNPGKGTKTLISFPLS